MIWWNIEMMKWWNLMIMRWIMDYVWRLLIFLFFSVSIFLLLPKGVPDSQTNDSVKKTCMIISQEFACNLTSQPFGHLQYTALDKVSPTRRSRRVILVRLWRCQGLGSLGRQRRSWEMKSLGLWPHLIPALWRLYIAQI